MTDNAPLRPEIKSEYDRWKRMVGNLDPYLSKFTIGIHEVLQAHFLLADFFSETGEGLGGIGPKDINLLHSALTRQFTYFGATPRWTDRIEVCATLMFGLIKNHPFFDANKRTAFLTSILHLQKIGRTPTASHEAYEDFTVAIADNSLSTYSFFQEINSPSPDKEILVMARFLKKHTRNIDLKSKSITYNQLQTILGNRGFRMENPNHNRIDVMKLLDDDTRKPLINPKRVGKIGFPSWSKEVSAKDINLVREICRLDASYGYDSQSFFNGLDGPLTLIKKYEEPLRRLAFR